MDLDRIIYGERLYDLLPGLRAFGDAMTIGDDGMYHASITLAPDTGPPSQRALMRAEAELLKEDADSVGSGLEEDRSYEQRAADALVRLAQAIIGVNER
jgi:hypothetical protein